VWCVTPMMSAISVLVSHGTAISERACSRTASSSWPVTIGSHVPAPIAV
jgi:hypothetical protein